MSKQIIKRITIALSVILSVWLLSESIVVIMEKFYSHLIISGGNWWWNTGSQETIGWLSILFIIILLSATLLKSMKYDILVIIFVIIGSVSVNAYERFRFGAVIDYWPWLFNLKTNFPDWLISCSLIYLLIKAIFGKETI